MRETIAVVNVGLADVLGLPPEHVSDRIASDQQVVALGVRHAYLWGKLHNVATGISFEAGPRAGEVVFMLVAWRAAWA